MPSICVYCGSRVGHDPSHRQAAEELAAVLLRHRLGLIYGAGRIGLMGVLADAMLAGGGDVIGVIPRALMDSEVAHAGLSRLEVVESMHIRKARMMELADAMVALPGGLGTLEELFEALTWAQLRFHSKPCGLLNVRGYFDPLLTFLDRALEEGFISTENRRLVSVESSPAQLLDVLLKTL
jgi:uncharacterized protein (TIGR00730 family)